MPIATLSLDAQYHIKTFSVTLSFMRIRPSDSLMIGFSSNSELWKKVHTNCKTLSTAEKKKKTNATVMQAQWGGGGGGLYINVRFDILAS